MGIVNYKTLLSVSFQHNYFSNLTFNGFKVAPIVGTEAYLAKRQLLLKKNSDGFNLVMNDDMAAIETKKQSLFSEQCTLQFSLTLTDQYLYNYTANLPENLPGSVFHFKNFSESNNNPALNNKLHINEYVSADDCVPVNVFKDLFTKPFAIISLNLFENMPDKYTIDFEAKETYWKYILVSDYLRDLERPAISSTGKIEFSGPETINLPDRSEALCFQSTTPILLSQENPNRFQLIDHSPTGTGKYNVIKRTLPIPDVRRVSSFTQQDYSNYSEMYI